ncbi:hypothetical protein HMPREF3038_00903 [Akkermansia sp. KLE1797]|nr:hypothetical protein HMPREF3038_00903 [Akkermansia sp. KLE1797]KXU54448.1 hypothetical protein HMPREF3039_01342 [Akkermansia sp. KLE1798]KZA04840.1 hypothetical protein HMPREF1326_01419 [Akkermansia sp. KLE1605]
MVQWNEKGRAFLPSRKIPAARTNPVHEPEICFRRLERMSCDY